MPRLERRKIITKPSASIRNLARNVDWKIKAESGEPIDASYIERITNGEKIFEQLIIWGRSQRSVRATTNNILRYLKYVASLDGSVSVRSLKDFKNVLEENAKANANTKNNVFGTCRNFVSFLMESEIIPTENLPKNFKRIHTPARSSIMELCRDAVSDFGKNNSVLIERLMKQHSLSVTEAETVAYGRHLLKRYHSLSIYHINEWLKDTFIVDNAINATTDFDKVSLEKITDFRESKGDWKNGVKTERSLLFAFKILFVKYGRLLPSSVVWPISIADYCKTRGWPPRRIQAAFFTGTYNLDYFLVAALSCEEIAPNVDTVAYYSYLDSFIPSNEKGKISIHMGKKRGSPVDATLPERSDLCKVFIFYQDRLRKLLGEVEGGKEWLNKENCELFIHYTTNQAGNYSIRKFDRAMTSYMVKRVTKKFAQIENEFQPLVQAGVTGENFRPTISACDILAGGSLGKLKQKLKHKNTSTTERYGLRIETQAVHDRKLTDFQNYLLSNRNKELPDTGTGYQCGIIDEPEISCGGVEACFNCEAKRVVLKDSKLISEWLAHVSWIKEHEKRLRFNNIERWNNFWEPKIAEYEALLAKCTRVEVKNAESLAQRIKLPFMD